MVSRPTRKIISLAISLLVAVISLTSVAMGAGVPTYTSQSRYTPGFTGAPGKIVRDTVGNFYVNDFWGKGIFKLDRNGTKLGFIPTNGRPSAVAVLADNRLAVAILSPQPKIAFYRQIVSASGVTGEEDTLNVFGTPTTPYFRPTGITVDNAGYIYVVDSGDNTTSVTVNVPKVRVYSKAGTFLHEFGDRTVPGGYSAAGNYLKQPMGITFEGKNGQIVVADTMNQQLKFYTPWTGTDTPGSGTVPYVASPGNIGVTGNNALFDAGYVTNAATKLGNPTDIAFEYDGTGALYRAYITERGRGEVVVVDMITNRGFERGRIRATSPNNAEMNAGLVYPTGAVFVSTATSGTSAGGLLYISNNKANGQGNILSMVMDGAQLPTPTVSLDITTTILPTYTSSSLPITGTVTAGNTVACTVNGASELTDDTTSGGTWSLTLTLLSGDNYILCRNTTGGAAAYAEARTMFVGTPATVNVSVAQPVMDPVSSNYVTGSTTVAVSGTTSVPYTTVTLVNSTNSTTVTARSDANSSWSANVTLLANNSNTISATATKSGYDAGTSVEITVIHDSVDPNVTDISFLSTGSVATTSVQNLSGIVLEKNLSSIEVNNVAVPAAALVSLAGNNTYFSFPVSLIRGSNNVTIKAIDRAGRSSTVTRTNVTLNPEIPGLAVDLPADNSYLPNGSTVAVAASGTAVTSFTSIDACGTTITPDAGSWSGTASIGAGLYTCEFKASGGNNADVKVKRTINNSSSYAQLAITSPAADLATKNSSVVINGSVAAGSAKPTISINGAAAVEVEHYTSGTGAFDHTVNFIDRGLYTVKVITSSTTAVRNIIYHTIPRRLALVVDSKSAPTSITGSIEPTAKISKITGNLNNANFDIPTTALTFAPYDEASDSVVWTANLLTYPYEFVTFESTDPAGNTLTMQYSSEIPSGDIDGDGVVRLDDALAALRHVAETETLDSTKVARGDIIFVDGHVAHTGAVDIDNALIILNKAFGLLNF